ncbi:hypothetical protein LB505_009281 [Fusarium chuoi]|nr:hypothetical protein LB505_009281 [Fusarium chuoi]
MVVGLARSIRQEYPSITLQTVDLDNATVGDGSWVPSFVASALRRIELLDKWKREEIANGADLNDKLQWTQESESECQQQCVIGSSGHRADLASACSTRDRCCCFKLRGSHPKVTPAGFEDRHIGLLPSLRWRC